MQINDVIAQYHELLTDEIAEEADADMRQKLKERSLYFGDRPLCVVLRPHFYQQAEWDFMQQGLNALLTAFARAHDICMKDNEHRAKLLLEDYEESLCEIDKDTPLPWSSSRLDTFYVSEERNLKCVEYNAETPAGIGYNDTLADVFDQLEPMKRFSEKYNFKPMRSLDTLQDALISAYREWGGREKPQIAILDWGDVPTLNEHEITRIHLEQAGYKTTLADPRALDYRDDSLMYGDFRIDLIYKRVLYSELIGRMGVNNNPVLEAVRDKAVYMTNSPSAKLMAKKASLAFLSDEQNSHLFTSSQQKAIHDHIPWTRVVSETKSTYNGQEIDLLEFITQNRDRLVLKPNDEYGGAGVVLGWQCAEDDWQATLQNAIETPHVVQEKVTLLQRDFPSWINGSLDISSRYVDADPYAFNGQDTYGCLTRLSPLALLNVTAGGGSVVPTYIISDK